MFWKKRRKLMPPPRAAATESTNRVFSAFGSRKPKSAQGMAPDLTLLEGSTGNKTLVLGLSWKAVVTAGTQSKTSRNAALKARATHMVVAPAILGLGRLTLKRADNLVSAAMLAAQHARDGLFALRLPDERVWLCTVQNGKPSGAELIMDSIADAIERLRQIKDGGGALSVYSDLQHVPGGAELLAFADLMLIPPGTWARVQPVGAQSLFKRIPVPVQVALGLVVFGLLGYEVYLQQQQDDKVSQSQAKRLRQKEEGQQLWTAVIAKELGKRAHHLDIQKLFDSFLPLPVQLQGWALQNAQCASSFANETKSWSCEASYSAPEPTTGKFFAPNSKVNVPAGFEVEYLPTKALKLTWQVKHAATPISQDALETVNHHLVQTASIVQSNLSSLMSTSDIKFSAIQVQPPKSEDGLVIDMPVNAVLLQQANISLRARFQVFKEFVALPVDWQTARLTLNPGDRPEIVLDMTGAIYAK
ncbi:type 4b pilus protein PilO2 [Limnohabitans sp. DM1]|uniref:type 4b pilus protein PilO2 n=1 Tax=Limnohabitans sp. DM1 TaxID=1597955 RepID=UPI000A86A795|nr:type 4b pilus protein PilO2 [Limnohabitans sp. DM1]